MDGILLAVIVIGGTGLLIGALLGIAGKILEVKVDEKEEAIREALPGNNCGGCGYAGCDDLAKAIAEGKAPVNACPVGGEVMVKAIGEVMGVDAKAVKLRAVIKCSGTCDKAPDKFNYNGNMSCREAMYISGGAKMCTYGCLGLGSCAEVCDKDAISIVDGIASVDKDKCMGCGKCAKACPRGIIEIIPEINEQYVGCSSHDTGKVVKSVCSVGCIGCKLCEKNCPAEAITVENNLPVIDYDKCVVCGICKEKCPVKCIK
ncbi:MAG: RnfABCDGE type electron transport complex subunit B [Lachnospiraceae bacterium]|nr:RnfABCDGE type electron transport complex subunit B [Lachnospiraceae bacterium]